MKKTRQRVRPTNVPGIYDIPESRSYRKPGMNKKLAKKILLEYGSPAHVKAYEELTGIKLDDKEEDKQSLLYKIKRAFY